MNYLLYGVEKYLIDKELKNIINKYNVTDLDTSKYDLEVNQIKEIIEDISTVSLFSNNKLIIVDNSYIFSKTTKKIDDIDLIEDYLSKKSDDVIVVFINNNEKIDNNKKLVKYIKNNGIIKEFNTPKNIFDTIKSMFGDYKITNDSINLLISRVGNNLEILQKEVEKLKLYKIDDKIITNSDIINLSCENINIDIFKFIDDIINKNKKNAIKTYHELLKLNEEPIKIIALLSSKFRLMLQVKLLSKKGYSEDKMSEVLSMHKYPIHLSLIASYKYSEDILMNYLNELANLDIGIKTGEKSNLSLELFILSI